MNIELLVWFIWNDFKFVFFTVKYGLERVKNGSIFCAAKTIKLQGRDVGNCTQRGWAKGSYCVVGGSNKVSCKNINVYARHIYALLPKRRSHSSKMDSLCSQTPERYCSFQEFDSIGWNIDPTGLAVLSRVLRPGLFVITPISRTNAYADYGRPILNQFIERFGLGRSVPTAKPLHLVPCQSGASSRCASKCVPP